MTVSPYPQRLSSWIASEMNQRVGGIVVRSEVIPSRTGINGLPWTEFDLLLTVTDLFLAKRLLSEMPLPRTRPSIRLQLALSQQNPIYGQNLYSGLDELGSGESQASRIEDRKEAIAARVKARKDAHRAAVAASDEDAFLQRKEAVERDLRQRGEMMALRAQAPIDRREEARKRASSERVQIAKDRIDERGTLATNRQVGRVERHASRLAEGSATQKSFLDFLETNRAARSTALQDAITSGLREMLTGRKKRLEAKESGREDRLSIRGKAKEGRIIERKRAQESWSVARKGVKEAPPADAATTSLDAWLGTWAPPESQPDEQIAGLDLFPSTDRFGASLMPIFQEHLERFGADPEFDAVPLVKAALVKAKKGALPDPATWTDGVRGTALPLVKVVRDWVVENIVIPAEAKEWDAVILAGAAAKGGQLQSEIKRYSDDDIAVLNRVVHRVLA